MNLGTDGQMDGLMGVWMYRTPTLWNSCPKRSMGEWSAGISFLTETMPLPINTLHLAASHSKSLDFGVSFHPTYILRKIKNHSHRNLRNQKNLR